MKEPEVAGAPAGAQALFPYMLLCAAPVIWGWSGVLVRWADLPGKEYVLIFWRSVFALAFYFVIMLLLRDLRLFRPGSGFLLLVASGLATAVYTICAFKAYNLIDIGTATFIIYLAPVFVALLAPLVLKERLERSTVLCLVIALAGTALLSLGQKGGGAAPGGQARCWRWPARCAGLCLC